MGFTILIISLSLLVVLFLKSEEEPITDGETLVACMGDSITEITGYPSDLQVLLGSNYIVGNFGDTGSKVLLDTDKPYLYQTSFQNASNFQPNIVIIMLGTNDVRPNIYLSIEKFVTDYLEMVRKVQQFKSEPKIWLATPPPIFENNLGLVNEYLIDGVIPRIKTVSNITGLPVIDVYSALAAHPEYFPDGVHPNREGAEAIANEVFNVISQ